MRVLIASKREPGRKGRRDGGVQTWIATIASELSKTCDVDIVGSTGEPNGAYDIGIFANANHTKRFINYCKRSALICHGVVADESPAEGFDVVGFTSEKVKTHWSGSGPVIHQPVDLDYWSPLRTETTGLIRYANRGGLEWLSDVAKDLGLPFTHLRNVAPGNALKTLQGASCVLATGRAALEAMACGVPVVICDDRPYQGPLLFDGPMILARDHNYSGRGGVIPTPENVTSAIRKALFLGSRREHMQQFHNVESIAQELLSL